MKYMRRAIPIEAVETGQYGFLEEPEWLQEALNKSIVMPIHYFGANVGFVGFKVLDVSGKWMEADRGDYIVRASDGTLYACKRSKFERDFMKIEEDNDEEASNNSANN